jgi:S1-C subfamily serine protease
VSKIIIRVIMFFASFAGACVPTQYQVPRARSPVEQMRSAVVVESRCVDDAFGEAIEWLPPSFGSGVVVTDRTIITAQHVVECPTIPQVHVTLTSGRRLRAYVSREDREHDRAVITIGSADRFWHGLAPPTGGVFEYVDHSVCAEVAFPRARRLCGIATTPSRATFVSRRGNSGSPVYDGAGNLVGITTAVSDDKRWSTIVDVSDWLPK